MFIWPAAHYPLSRKTRARTQNQNLEVGTGLLSLVHSACILTQLKTTSLGVAPPTVGGTLLTLLINQENVPQAC